MVHICKICMNRSHDPYVLFLISACFLFRILFPVQLRSVSLPEKKKKISDASPEEI